MPTVVTCAADISFTAAEAASGVLLIRAAEEPSQQRQEERLEVDGARVEEHRSPAGARPLRLFAEADEVAIRYRTTVLLEPPAPAPPDAPLPGLGDLDLDLLHWTLPSRYCPSDLLAPTATSLFGAGQRTAALLEEVRSWVEEHIAYVPGVSDALTGADETLLRRAGVCRDLAHLTCSLLRAMTVPARLVAGYALDLDPPDFHALVEAHDGTGWRVLDATGLAPVETVTRIATGRDAAEIAWSTGSGLTLQDLSVRVERA